MTSMLLFHFFEWVYLFLSGSLSLIPEWMSLISVGVSFRRAGSSVSHVSKCFASHIISLSDTMASSFQRWSPILKFLMYCQYLSQCSAGCWLSTAKIDQPQIYAVRFDNYGILQKKGASCTVREVS